MKKKRNIFKTHKSHLKGKHAKYPFGNFKKPSKDEITNWEIKFNKETKK